MAGILVARLLGPGNYGLYNLALVVPGLLQLVVSFGTNSAITWYGAYLISKTIKPRP